MFRFHPTDPAASSGAREQMHICTSSLRKQIHRLFEVTQYEIQLLAELEQFKNSVRRQPKR